MPEHYVLTFSQNMAFMSSWGMGWSMRANSIQHQCHESHMNMSRSLSFSKYLTQQLWRKGSRMEPRICTWMERLGGSRAVSQKKSEQWHEGAGVGGRTVHWLAQGKECTITWDTSIIIQMMCFSLNETLLVVLSRHISSVLFESLM